MKDQRPREEKSHSQGQAILVLFLSLIPRLDFPSQNILSYSSQEIYQILNQRSLLVACPALSSFIDMLLLS